MGEFMHTASGGRVKVGTCEDLIYLREEQRHQVFCATRPGDPCSDADVNADLGVYRFRFPWPDEDGIEPGHFRGERYVEIPGYTPEPDFYKQLQDEKPLVAPIRLGWQGHREGELRAIVRDSAEPSWDTQLFQLPKVEAIRAAISLLEYSRCHEAPQYHDGGFYRDVAKRMLAGYGLDLDQLRNRRAA